MKESKFDEKSMKCTSNFEDQSCYSTEESTEELRGGDESSCPKEAPDVDLLECLGHKDWELELPECNDETDTSYTSSFSGTLSESESVASTNGQEVESRIVLPFVRKKKLTEKWRSYEQQTKWRCKWLELKIKELESQARTYDKKLEKSYQIKQSGLEDLKSGESGIKALPTSSHTRRTKLYKRKKRKKLEDITNVQSYMSNHNIFSYYEYRKSFAHDGAVSDEKLQNQVDNGEEVKILASEETPPLEFKESDSDAFLEQILFKIEAAKLESRHLKTRVNKFLTEIPETPAMSLIKSPDIFTSSNSEQKFQSRTENDDLKVTTPVNYVSISSQQNTSTEDIPMSETATSSLREEKPDLDKKSGPSTYARKGRKSCNRESEENGGRPQPPRARGDPKMPR